ncbi:MAG: hypothetical protein LWW85_10970, partial [Marinilabiliales bacterium]|nr:hypothetical protein [Marinilabiliales bacterium]
MKSFRPTCLLLFMLWIVVCSAGKVDRQQKIGRLYEEALALSREGNSTAARQRLLTILQLDSLYAPACFALADLDHESGAVSDEIRWLKTGLRLSPDTYPPGYRFLAEMLYKKGDYAEALASIERYITFKGEGDPAVALLHASCRFSVEAMAHPLPFHPIDPGDSINTAMDEYWPSLNAEANHLVFTRLVKGNQSKLAQEDFFETWKDSLGWHKALPMGPPIQTPENEGAQTLSADGSVNMGEPVNSGAWESQPSLSADGSRLFFVSSRAGGKGKMDLWMAEKVGTTEEGIPLFDRVSNVEALNTPGNEFSPFLHADGTTLYFA